jgi:hypothetical protein
MRHLKQYEGFFNKIKASLTGEPVPAEEDRLQNDLNFKILNQYLDAIEECFLELKDSDSDIQVKTDIYRRSSIDDTPFIHVSIRTNGVGRHINSEQLKETLRFTSGYLNEIGFKIWRFWFHSKKSRILGRRENVEIVLPHVEGGSEIPDELEGITIHIVKIPKDSKK